MPTKNDKRVTNGPVPDFSDVLGEDFDNRGGDRNDLKRAADTVTRKYEEAMQENESLRAKEAGPGALLVIIVFVIAGRLALYAFVENWGTAAVAAGRIVSGIAAAIAAVILCVWAKKAWDRSAWLMIPGAVLVLVSIVICASAISGGALLEGAPASHAVHPGLVALCACIGLLIGASPLFIWLIKHTMEFLNHPGKKLGGKS